MPATLCELTAHLLIILGGVRARTSALWREAPRRLSPHHPMLREAKAAQAQNAASAPAACAVLQDSDCSWAWQAGACMTLTQQKSLCLAASCGFFSCECERTPPSLLPPWTVLNISAQACPDEVKSAFIEHALRLHPNHNPGCPRLASREFVAALRARDAMLSIAPWMQHGQCDAMGDGDSSAGYKEEGDDGTETGPIGGRAPVVQHAWKYIKEKAKTKWNRLKHHLEPVTRAFHWLATSKGAFLASVLILCILQADKIALI
mmetsp:Transcript_9994/g.21683  ORF Transcript_9994/g.21683 Transcript_9994/m.21683 type:complete len:262 (-) Transcript_9994:447-1232(-)